MKVLGIDMKRYKIWFCVMEGTKETPILIKTGVLDVLFDANRVPFMMSQYESLLEELIRKEAPDKIAYKFYNECDKDSQLYVQFPQGLLNLICHQKRIPIVHFCSLNFTCGRFGLEKGRDINKACDEVFQKPRPYPESKRGCLLSAWAAL